MVLLSCHMVGGGIGKLFIHLGLKAKIDSGPSFVRTLDWSLSLIIALALADSFSNFISA